MAEELSGAAIRRRIDALAAISAQADGLTRVYLSPEHRRANALVSGWMRDVGMSVRVDAVGNVIGRYAGHDAATPALLLGSHLDSVADAGRWDGPLGVVSAVACVANLYAAGRRLPRAIEVVGFADEEGTRFGATMLGSRGLAGTFDRAVLAARDAQGIDMAQAMRDWGLDPDRIGEAARPPGSYVGYLELHIEQGPVLEQLGLATGCVSAIAGATRLRVTLTGEAGHAGTVPMRLRHDALAAAAACVLAIERLADEAADAVATVGRLDVSPGAVNVIPGGVAFTVDIRAPRDGLRQRLLTDIRCDIATLCGLRGVGHEIAVTHELDASPCAPWLMARIDDAIGHRPATHLASGAGHDGMALRGLCDIGMIFVRCAGGVSHHPAESVTDADAEAGARVLMHVIESFA